MTLLPPRAYRKAIVSSREVIDIHLPKGKYSVSNLQKMGGLADQLEVGAFTTGIIATLRTLKEYL